MPQASTCIADKCNDQLDICLKDFDTCSCMPGLLKCVAAECSGEEAQSISDCEKFQNDATSCDLTCKPSSYPILEENDQVEVVYEVVAKVELAGITEAEFTTSLSNSFKEAVAESLDGVVKENVFITGFSDKQVTGGRTRYLKNKPGDRNLMSSTGTTVLQVDFKIKLKQKAALESAQGTLNEIASNSEGTGSSSGSPEPSVFAMKLEQKGVITDANQLSVKEVKSKVTVVDKDQKVDDNGSNKDSSRWCFIFIFATTLIVFLQK
jgi:hypothetical protein